ncbi:MAG: 2,3-bisphosphoglycerate-independent phosphoglycerate mutase [Clostridia bacterium]|nr:2,3-bisphosphoglycerate-independent phosphoglycerate mutase [Clostridia bacterium]
MKQAPAVLLILDGYGLAPAGEGNAVTTARTPVLDKLFATWPHTRLSASGLDVGLPAGQFGNSEVGHTNLGAGRVVYQDLARITKSIDDGEFYKNEALFAAVNRCAGEEAPALHLMGLLSDGGVHSHMEHVYALVELARRQGVRRLFVHAFTDGRDVPPTSAVDYIAQLQGTLWEKGVGQLATVCGRYYAMDRDSRWERLKLAYDCLVEGEGERVEDIAARVRRCYEEEVTDEFLPPMITAEASRVQPGDSVIFFNFRPDRAREMTRALLEPAFEGFPRPKGALPLTYVCMTQYDAKFADFPARPAVAFPPHDLKLVLGEVLSAAGLRQARLAETEKYAHVTFFLNGGREEPFAGEHRVLVPSPKVATYDLQPEMSAPAVAEEAVKLLKGGEVDVLICNLANCDMVGHTGILPAAVAAVEAVDAAVGRIVDAAVEAGGFVLLTADHGNAETMFAEDGGPMTAHTSNPVPLIAIHAGVKGLKEGRLCDVAPTLLDRIGLSKPDCMSGESLVVD